MFFPELCLAHCAHCVYCGRCAQGLPFPVNVAGLAVLASSHCNVDLVQAAG